MASSAPFPFTSGPGSQLLPLVQQMRRHDFDVLVVVANSLDAAMFCQQVRKIDWQVQLALSDWSATEQLLNLGGRSVEGAIISQFFNRESSAPLIATSASASSRSTGANPVFGSLHAYNAVMLIRKSMAARRSNESLKDAILRLSHFSGLQDDIVINRFGDAHLPTYIGVVTDGAYVILEDFR